MKSVLFCCWLAFVLMDMTSCTTIKDVDKYQNSLEKFPWSSSCGSMRDLMDLGTKTGGLYCFTRDLVDGKREIKKEVFLSRALSGGHRVIGSGAYYLSLSNVRLDMKGFGVFSNRHARGGVRVSQYNDQYVSDVGIYNGVLDGISDVFALGGQFVEIDDDSYFLDGNACGFQKMGSRIWLDNMAIIGPTGNVVADESGVMNSSLYMAGIYYSGTKNFFRGNKYVVTNIGTGFESGVSSGDGLVYHSEKPILKRFVNGSIASYDHAAGLYLSCADNAVIDGNIFSSLKGRPEVPAIVLKRSRNVRITNNTFEGFAMPVLMDKYSSIIDSSGNIIKPDITAENPASLLYKLKLEPRPVGTQTKAQPQLKSG